MPVLTRFKDPIMQGEYASVVTAFDARQPPLFVPGTETACLGSSPAEFFWKGFFNFVPPNWRDVRGQFSASLRGLTGYAYVRGGVDCRKQADRAYFFVTPPPAWDKAFESASALGPFLQGEDVRAGHTQCQLIIRTLQEQGPLDSSVLSDITSPPSQKTSREATRQTTRLLKLLEKQGRVTRHKDGPPVLWALSHAAFGLPWAHPSRCTS